MLVEDDKSLREIYGVRLLAEGYDIVSASDGEEALAIAIKEKPQLIISDVMMPKVSGYDMLDILRSTIETRNIRVIMMTALSSDEQRARAEALGADRYLVKSQVGIEDVVRVVHEVLEDTPETAQPVAPAQPQPAPVATPQQSVQTQPAPQPQQPAPVPTPVPLPTPANTPNPVTGSSVPKPASIKSRVIQPINDPMSTPVDLNELLDKELAKEAGITEESRPPVTSIDQQKALVDEQIQAFTPPAFESTPQPAAPAPVPQQPVQPQPVPQPLPPSSLPTPGISNIPTPQPAAQPLVQPQPVVTQPLPPAPQPTPQPVQMSQTTQPQPAAQPQSQTNLPEVPQI